MHPLYKVLLKDVVTDIGQMVEEGHDQQSLLAELERVKAPPSLDALAQFQEALWQRPSPGGFPYQEPNDWDAIARTFPPPNTSARFTGKPDELADRLLAGWQGRCVGCQLGKPLEGRAVWPDDVKQALEFVGSWPLTDYMKPLPPGTDLTNSLNATLLKKFENRDDLGGKFNCVQPDDDIHYAIAGQLTLEAHGAEFTSENAMGRIVALFPSSRIYSAGLSMLRASLFGLPQPYTAMSGNPCRQSLGAMIRCDPWGWGAPANPDLAAKMAYKDARCSQTRNGIYGGMFFAALIADTLAHSDPVRAIETAARYVPPNSRLAEVIRLVRDECARGSWEQAARTLIARYPREAKTVNHALVNAGIVLIGLLKGEGDFTRTIGITVMCGQDTDCTGATAGSIMGCAVGAKGIPQYWTAPFNDTIKTDLPAMAELTISGLAARLFAAAEKNARYAN
jgi:hypothetical protein